ncbi:hypothetical protein [Paenibacillus sp. FSL W8-0194]|uniref:hypothetical protein n=1 Tax=Paenibacillus sp. FSL W8-0194 TaxID=2921711 RepID=UPI0030DD66A2
MRSRPPPRRGPASARPASSASRPCRLASWAALCQAPARPGAISCSSASTSAASSDLPLTCATSASDIPPSSAKAPAACPGPAGRSSRRQTCSGIAWRKSHIHPPVPLCKLSPGSPKSVCPSTGASPFILPPASSSICSRNQSPHFRRSHPFISVRGSKRCSNRTAELNAVAADNNTILAEPGFAQNRCHHHRTSTRKSSERLILHFPSCSMA